MGKIFFLPLENFWLLLPIKADCSIWARGFLASPFFIDNVFSDVGLKLERVPYILKIIRVSQRSLWTAVIIVGKAFNVQND